MFVCKIKDTFARATHSAYAAARPSARATIRYLVYKYYVTTMVPILLLKVWCKKVNHRRWYIKKPCLYARARAYLTTWNGTALSYHHNSKSRGDH